MGLAACRRIIEGGHAGIPPPAEELDLVLAPTPIAGHPPGFELLQDRVGVVPHILGLPEVEHHQHRLLIALGEQRLDVLLERDLVGRLHRCSPPRGMTGPSSARLWSLTHAPASAVATLGARTRDRPQT